MPATEYQLTLDRRELASILAGLRLLQWSDGASRALPYAIARLIDCIADEYGVELLAEPEIRELVRRLA